MAMRLVPVARNALSHSLSHTSRVAASKTISGVTWVMAIVFLYQLLIG